MTHEQIKTYCIQRLQELRPILTGGTPWGFLCVAAFVDFLAKLAWGEDQKRAGYKDFVALALPAPYSSFRYASGEVDLPDQLYHVFRCGILHSFSLVPDALAEGSGGRSRSIAISHNGGRSHHLTNYTEKGMDAALLAGGPLCDDLLGAVSTMFDDHSIQRNAEKWVSMHPPISGL